MKSDRVILGFYLFTLLGYTYPALTQEADEDFMTLDSVESPSQNSESKPEPDANASTESENTNITQEDSPVPEPKELPPDPVVTEEPAHKNYTTSYEKYEDEEKNRYKKVKPAHWSFGMAYVLNVFSRADLRARQELIVRQNFKNPRLYGFTFTGERFLFQNIGVGSAGAEFSIYSRPSVDGFAYLFPGFLSPGAFAKYRARFVHNQWVIPFARGGAEWLYYSYQFNGGKVNGFRFMPRMEFGLDVFLNYLDPSASRDMYFNYKIVRAYLTAAYSINNDFNKKDFDLTDRSFRVGFRLEL